MSAGKKRDEADREVQGDTRLLVCVGDRRRRRARDRRTAEGSAERVRATGDGTCSYLLADAQEGAEVRELTDLLRERGM